MLDSDRLYALIGERIRQMREGHTPRMSQGGLAEILGLKRTSVTNIEKGNQKPTLDTLYRLCEHFGIDFGQVLPPIAEVTRSEPAPEARSFSVGGKSQKVGAKTANVLDRIRPAARTRR